MLGKIFYTIGFMLWQVAVKGAISGALWVMFWMWADMMRYDDMSLGFLGSIGGIGLIGAGFGLVMGAILGALIGIGYAISNALFLRYHTHMASYRRNLMIVGGLVAYGVFAWILGGLEMDGGWTMISGGALAAAGVVVSTYVYVPKYVYRYVQDDYYTPYKH
jgi:hypothetical protein